jgi:uncharacterized protein YlzI (FlbEa/FlbD family)
MAKFIALTENGPQGRMVVINIDSIEYMMQRPNSNITEVVSVTHHTKYLVRETLEEILNALDESGHLVSIVRKTPSIMEVKNDENNRIQ